MLLFSGKRTSLYAIAAHYVDVRRTSLKSLALCKLHLGFQEMYYKPQSLFVSPKRAGFLQKKTLYACSAHYGDVTETSFKAPAADSTES